MSKTTIPTGGITDGTIATGDIADDAVGNTKLDLSANYAFTGTITGTPNNLVQVSSVSLGTSGAYAHNGIFSSTYDTYLITMDQIQCATADTHIKFKFYNNTGATSDNTYRGYYFQKTGEGDSSQDYHNSYPFLSVAQNGTSNQGLSGVLWVNNPVTSGVETTFWYHTSFMKNSGYSGISTGGGFATDYGSRTHTGFYWFTSQGNFGGRAKVVVYGVKRT